MNRSVVAMLGRSAIAVAPLAFALTGCKSKSERDYQSDCEQGDQAMVRGDYSQAKEHFERALAYDPFNAVLCNKLGMANFRLGKVDEAINFYRHALAIDPRYDNARGNLRLAMAVRGGKDEATVREEWAAEADRRAREREQDRPHNARD